MPTELINGFIGFTAFGFFWGIARFLVWLADWREEYNTKPHAYMNEAYQTGVRLPREKEQHILRSEHACYNYYHYVLETMPPREYT